AVPQRTPASDDSNSSSPAIVRWSRGPRAACWLASYELPAARRRLVVAHLIAHPTTKSAISKLASDRIVASTSHSGGAVGFLVSQTGLSTPRCATDRGGHHAGVHGGVV